MRFVYRAFGIGACTLWLAIAANGSERNSIAIAAQAEIDKDPSRFDAVSKRLVPFGLAALRFDVGSASVQSISRVTGGAAPFRDCAVGLSCPDMVLVPASPKDFKIGSPPDEPKRLSSEAQHSVAIKPFAIGQFEVRVAEYMACVKANACRPPEWLEPGGEHNIETGRGVTYKSMAEFIKGDDQPIVGISWGDASAFAAWLSKSTGRHYRLPSEAEWEYAARADTSTAYWWGSDAKRATTAMACCRGCGSDRDGKGFYPVKSFQANPWGLYNVHGNVWEWVADYFCEAYSDGPTDGAARTNPKCMAPTSPEADSSPEGLRIFRGGSCFYDPSQMRAGMRLRNWPAFRNLTVGFRVARDIMN